MYKKALISLFLLTYLTTLVDLTNHGEHHIIDIADSNEAVENWIPYQRAEPWMCECKGTCKAMNVQVGDLKHLQKLAKVERNPNGESLVPLSNGGTADVFLANDKASRRCVVIKVIRLFNAKTKEPISKDHIALFEKEILILKYLNTLESQKHIIKLLASERRKDHILIVLERGVIDLFDHLEQMHRSRKNKEEVQNEINHVIEEVLTGLSELHTDGAHLDLKEQNIMQMEEKDQIGMPKYSLIDFGGSELFKISKIPRHNGYLTIEEYKKLADASQKSSNSKESCSIYRTVQFGDREYASPEHHFKCEEKKEHYKFSPKSDIWAFGIILYHIIYHQSPYFTYQKGSIYEQDVQMMMKCGHKNVNYKIGFLTNFTKILVLSPEVYNGYLQMIKACLQPDPRFRPTAKGLLDFMANMLEIQKVRNSEKRKTCQKFKMQKLPENCPNQGEGFIGEIDLTSGEFCET